MEFMSQSLMCKLHNKMPSAALNKLWKLNNQLNSCVSVKGDNDAADIYSIMTGF